MIFYNLRMYYDLNSKLDFLLVLSQLKMYDLIELIKIKIKMK